MALIIITSFKMIREAEIKKKFEKNSKQLIV